MGQRNPGGGTEGHLLRAGHGVEQERDFPAESGLGLRGVAVHHDGFEVHEAVAAGRGQMDAEDEGGAWFTGAVAAKYRAVRADLLQLEMGKRLS